MVKMFLLVCCQARAEEGADIRNNDFAEII